MNMFNKGSYSCQVEFYTNLFHLLNGLLRFLTVLFLPFWGWSESVLWARSFGALGVAPVCAGYTIHVVTMAPLTHQVSQVRPQSDK